MTVTNEYLKYIEEKNDVLSAYQSFTHQHELLSLIYSALLDSTSHNTSYNTLLPILIEMIYISDILICIYSKDIIRSNTVKKLKKQQDNIQKMLLAQGIEVPPVEIPMSFFIHVTEVIREEIPFLNWFRILTIRTKKVMDALLPFFKASNDFHYVMLFINHFANPLILWIGWLFFIPRLFANLFELTKGCLFYLFTFFSEQKNTLSFLGWLQLELDARWFEIFNDAAWLTAGILCCFVLVGTLAPVAMYLNVSLFVYDVVLALLRFMIETIKLSTYLYTLSQCNFFNKENKLFRNALLKRFIYEEATFLLTVASTTGLLVGIILCTPIIVTNPTFILVGASIILGTTLINFILTKALDSLKSQTNLDVQMLEKTVKTNSPLSVPTFPTFFSQKLIKTCASKEEVREEDPLRHYQPT